MAIGPIEMNGAVGRTADYASMRLNEEQRGIAEQHTIVHGEEKKAEEKHTQVQTSQQSEKQQLKGDAREKGGSEYAGDGGRRRPGKNGDIPVDGVVIVNGGGFDVKI